MNTSQVDYDELADLFDRGRALSPAKEGFWLALIAQHLGLCANSRVLDVGCGTGRFAIPVARWLRCSVTGIDASPSMLAKARVACNGEVKWILAKAEAIPVPQNTFDACLASQVIHHLQDKQRAFAEMYRVLRPSGRLGIRFSSHAQLRAILDYRFFPSALGIDLRRLPDIEGVRSLIQEAGFHEIEEQVVRQRLFESAEDYLEKLRSKYSSVLSLIPEEEYRQGLQNAAAYLAGRDLGPVDQQAEITFLVGIK